MSGTVQTLYNLLSIQSKIQNEPLRLLYLKDVWGLEQAAIGECEGRSQSYISKELIKARQSIPHQDFLNASEIQWTADELKYIQFLPREIITDVQVIAFINDVLGVEILHPFYMHFNHAIDIRIAALYSLGIQNKRLVQIYNRKQSSVSMIVKRSTEKALTLERNNRYDSTADFVISQQRKHQNKFTLAGGIF